MLMTDVGDNYKMLATAFAVLVTNATNSSNYSEAHDSLSGFVPIGPNKDNEALTSHIVEIIVATHPRTSLGSLIPRESLVKLTACKASIRDSLSGTIETYKCTSSSTGKSLTLAARSRPYSLHRDPVLTIK